MRSLFLIAGAAFALALAGCGNNDQTDNTQNVDENLMAENIVSNDVTAIDAITGDAANMAADVDYSNLLDNSLDNMVNQTGESKPGRPRRGNPPPVSEPTANSASNTTE